MSIDQRIEQPRERIGHEQDAGEDIATPDVYEAYNLGEKRDEIERTHGIDDDSKRHTIA